MGIRTFDAWVSPQRQAIAQRTYGDLVKTQSGQIQLLRDAQEGNTVAADYLFTTLKKIISKAFWQYYLGPDTSKHQARLLAGADMDFASMAYEMLLGSGETSPFETFDVKKFSPKADLIKQFGYYLYRYLQNEAFKMIRTDRMGGMTGNIKTGDEVSVTDIDSHAEVSSTTNHEEEAVMKDTIKRFMKQLKAEKAGYYEVFKGRLEGKSIDDIAKELKVSDITVRNYLKAIRDLYNSFTK